MADTQHPWRTTGIWSLMEEREEIAKRLAAIELQNLTIVQFRNKPIFYPEILREQ
jgi:hypothetical protein